MLIISIGAVNANDVNGTDVLSISDTHSNSVIGIDNDEEILSASDEVYVNGSAPAGGSGTQDSPYNTLKEGIDNVNAGGCIYIAPGIYTGSDSNVNVEISKNITIDRYGGGDVIFDGQNSYGIISAPENTDITINHMIFQNGVGFSSGLYGGAILSEGILTVNDSVFINNKAVYGGAIMATTDLKLNRCNFTGNSASSNRYYSYGGTICAYGATLDMKYCNINDSSVIHYGGAIFSSNTLNIDYCNFTNSNAEYYGGVISASSQVNINNSKFDNNFAWEYGGALYVIGQGGLDIDNSNFTNNRVTYQSSGYGGAIHTTVGSNKISNSIFDNNTGMRAGALSVATAVSNVNVVNCNFTNNKATRVNNDGGAVWSQSTTCKFVFEDSNFINNTAANNGGAISVQSDLTISNSTFVNNNASTHGGAVFAGNNFNITNSKFINNNALNSTYSRGGAICKSDSGTENIVSDSYFANNSAFMGGVFSLVQELMYPILNL